MLGFLHISLIDVIDVLLIAVLIFYAFRLLRGSQAMSIFIAIVILLALRIVADALNMKLMSGLLGAVLDVGLIALIVIFQPEIRRFLTSIGTKSRRFNVFMRLLGRNEQHESAETINEICKACEEMAALQCGALIVVQRSTSLNYIEATGDAIDAKVSKRLLMNLFFKNSPLHDGAVIISGDRVAAARCTLPISQQDLPASFGMRHKAATGMSETSDAIVIVVSEQTGHICVMQHGGYTMIQFISDLKRILQS